MTVVDSLSIGELAEASGASVSAIRYYEKRELLTHVGRVGGKRRFAPEHVDRLLFLRRAKGAGFSLDQIKVLLEGTKGDAATVLFERLEVLRQTRVELDQTITFLERAVECGCADVAQCKRVIEVGHA